MAFAHQLRFIASAHETVRLTTRRWRSPRNGRILARMPLTEATEAVLRLTFFLSIFAALAVSEQIYPRRTRTLPRMRRWPSNIGVSVLNQAMTRLFLPATAIATAAHAQNGWGLLAHVALPSWLEITIAVLLLDLAIYAQHVLYHAVPVLWRLHRMHHADTEFDVTTGVRFHPLSMLLSGLIKLGAVVIIGASPLAVLIFEVLLNATSLFNHSNLRLALSADRVVRRLVVTPDMHRVHHSSDPSETNRNFGFNFPWWDHLFGTYKDQPALGHQGLVVGLGQFRDPGELRLDRMLIQPFRAGVPG